MLRIMQSQSHELLSQLLWMFQYWSFMWIYVPWIFYLTVQFLSDLVHHFLLIFLYSLFSVGILGAFSLLN